MSYKNPNSRGNAINRLVEECDFVSVKEFAAVFHLRPEMISRVITTPSYYQPPTYRKHVVSIVEAALQYAPNDQKKRPISIQSHAGLLSFLKIFFTKEEDVREAIEMLQEKIPGVMRKLGFNKGTLKMLYCTLEEIIAIRQLCEFGIILSSDPSQFPTIKDSISEMGDTLRQVTNKISDHDIS